MTWLGTVDRWLLRRFLSAFLAFLVVGTLLFLIVDFPVNLTRLQKRGLDQSVPLRYATMLPELFFVAAPYLTLLSALWVVTSLRRADEFLALTTLGYSGRRIGLSLVLAGAVVTPLAWIDREYLLPHLGELRRAQAALGSMGWTAPRPVPDAQGGVLLAAAYSRGSGELADLCFAQLDEEGRERFSVWARKGEYQAAQGQTSAGWLLSEGVAIERVAAAAAPGAQERVQVFGAQGFLLECSLVPGDLDSAEGPSYVSAEELRARLGRTPAFVHLQVELWQRYTQPLGGLALLLLCLPMLLTPRTLEGSALGLRCGLCLLIGVVFFVLVALCEELGCAGALPPALAVGLAPGGAAGLGALLFLRRNQ